MIVIVSGGRNRVDEETIHSVLDLFPIKELVVGDAKGVDRIAALWAKRKGIPARIHVALWNREGKAAGHKRNARMLADHKVDLVIAFPSSTSIGTWDMVDRARWAKVPRIIIR